MKGEERKRKGKEERKEKGRREKNILKYSFSFSKKFAGIVPK